MISRYLLTASVFMLTAVPAFADPADFLKKKDSWFAGDDAQRIAGNILSFQSEAGGWPKNQNTTTKPYSGERAKLKPTYDNGATTDELRFLARIYTATKNERYLTAFERGVDYILQGQYSNGGWPQSSPPGNGYHRHITFNDGAMVRLLFFLREVASTKAYDFVDDKRQRAATTAIEGGINCILKCQIRVDGKLTVWCAQHDEIDFRPRSARSYELATLSGSESVGMTRFLMSVEQPSPQIIDSVEAAVAWFKHVKLNGIRVAKNKDSNAAGKTNKVVVRDQEAPALWARFYHIQTNTPVFADRDGIPKQALADIGNERRNGYSWYGTWPQRLLAGEYQKWKQRIAIKANTSSPPPRDE